MSKNKYFEQCSNAGWLEEICSECGKRVSKSAVLDGSVEKGETVQQYVLPIVCSCKK